MVIEDPKGKLFWEIASTDSAAGKVSCVNSDRDREFSLIDEAVDDLLFLLWTELFVAEVQIVVADIVTVERAVDYPICSTETLMTQHG